MNKSDSCGNSNRRIHCPGNSDHRWSIENNHFLKPSPSRKRSREIDGNSGSGSRRKKAAVSAAAMALLGLKQLDDDGDVHAVPLIYAKTGFHCRSIHLKPNRPYTIGRSTRCSKLVFDDPRVSKQHCQILFDASRHKIYLLHGAFVFPDASASMSAGLTCLVREFRCRLLPYLPCDKIEDTEEMDTAVSTCVVRFRPSRNGLFVNGVRIGKGLVTELLDGDEVMLVCANEHGLCHSGPRIGFVIQKIVFQEAVVPGYDVDDYIQADSQQEFSPLSSGKVNKRVFALKVNECEVFKSKCDGLVGRASTYLTICKRILRSDDPISYIRRCIGPTFQVDDTYSCRSENDFLGLEPSNNIKSPLNGELQAKCVVPVFRQQTVPCDTSQMIQSFESVRDAMVRPSSIVTLDALVAVAPLKVKGDCLCTKSFAAVPVNNGSENNNPYVSWLDSLGKGDLPHSNDVRSNKCPSPGKNFYLNRLGSMDCSSSGLPGQGTVVSLPELLYPVESISQIFIATLTSDILWFLSYCEIPHDLPVTIACHNTEKCWSADPDNRSLAPYPDFPNLVMVYPSFPEAIAFGNDRKKQGIGCHHPKLFVVQREDSIRVIVTSANLNETQWNSVTNTIWWQDFPRRDSPDYSSLFNQLHERNMDKSSKSDFAEQLAGFMASLVIDVPSQAHWIVELAKYDFGGAMGYLIASVPGIHSYRPSSIVEPMQFLADNHHQSCSLGIKLLGITEASVVGLSHLFHTADRSGARLKKLAAFLGNSCEKTYGMSEIVLRRNKNVPADANAVTISVADPKDFFEGDYVQLGFLPKSVAKWVSPLWDIGIFRFSGYVYPQEALAAALAGNSTKVKLILRVLQGPNFEDIAKVMQPEHVTAFCSLIASIQRCTGLWRLEQVLSQHKWPETLESDFIYGSSSIGSSVSAKFLAAFSSASGKRSLQSLDSEESDPEWGCWNATQELKSPSIGIIFPTIERVKNACNGVLPSRRILCFSEKTWERLKTVDILHDAIPHPCSRLGRPIHVKVARRRFQSERNASSFGWVYCGSHNFSAAAWGQPISCSSSNQINEPKKNNLPSDLRLHVCNYELGIVFVFPPSETGKKNSPSLDDIVLPFVVPAPKYGSGDRPATKKAMREALTEVIEEQEMEVHGGEDVMEEIPDEEEEAVKEVAKLIAKEEEEENEYAQVLWTQVNSL